MKNVTSILSLVCLVELTCALNVTAERISHHPWFAHRSEIEFTPTSSSHPLALSPGGSPQRQAHRGPKGDRIVEQASRYRGVRYRFGGDSKSKGFDCSGLV